MCLLFEVGFELVGCFEGKSLLGRGLVKYLEMGLYSIWIR